MTISLISLATITAVIACWLYLRECSRRRADTVEAQVRLRAALTGLQQAQNANNILRAAVSERERTIGILLRRLNEANVVRLAEGKSKTRPRFALGLPQLKVAPSQFNRN